MCPVNVLVIKLCHSLEAVGAATSRKKKISLWVKKRSVEINIK